MEGVDPNQRVCKALLREETEVLLGTVKGILAGIALLGSYFPVAFGSASGPAAYMACFFLSPRAFNLQGQY